MSHSFVFIDESGIAENSQEPQPFFGLGLLKIKETGPITEALLTEHYNVYSHPRAQRRSFLKELESGSHPVTQREISLLLSTTHHHEFKFTNLTWKNLERYKSFVDAAFAFPLHFCALVVQKASVSRFNEDQAHHYWDACIDYSKILCERNSEFLERLTVIMDYMCRPKSSVRILEEELGKSRSIANVIRSQSIAFPLLQLSDLLLGVTLHQWKQKNGYVRDSNRSRCKEAFVEHVLTYINIAQEDRGGYPLAREMNARGKINFQVIEAKS